VDVNEITHVESVIIYFGARPRRAHGDKTMGIAQQTSFQITKGEVRSRDMTILLGYAAFAIVLLLVIYLDSMSSGTAHGDLTLMTVFP
jgi:hypothetical protein